MIGKIFTFLGAYMTVRNLALHVLLSLLPAIYVKLFSKKLKGSPELNKKYAPFARIDYQKWGFKKFALCNIFLLAVPRICIAWCMCIITISIINLLKIVFRHKKGDIVPRHLDRLFRLISRIPVRIHMLMCGVYSIKQT